MNIEYEATFSPVNKTEIRRQLKRVGAKLVRPEFLQKRVVFDLPKGHRIKGGWMRVRDEGDQITMSLKVVNGNKIHNQKEICLVVDNFQQAAQLLITIGCHQKSYQESKRELWRLDGVEITIDTWPFLKPFVEVEGRSEMAVKRVSKKIGFDYATAKFCATDVLYIEQYGMSFREINFAPKIVFNMKNPFSKK